MPHAGLSLGFERTLAYVTGLANVRDAIPFSRTPRNCAEVRSFSDCLALAPSGLYRLRREPVLVDSLHHRRTSEPVGSAHWVSLQLWQALRCPAHRTVL